MDQKMRFLPHNTIYQGRKWNAGVYVRLSDEDRDKSDHLASSRSIQNQIDYIQNSIELMNAHAKESYPVMVYRIYSDDDFTGLNFDRGGFREMMQDIRDGVVDMVAIRTLSRLGRDDSEMQRLLKKDFEQTGKEVRVYAVGDAFDSLYDVPTDISISLTLLMNEHYSQIQHKNVSIGMHTMQKQGKFIGAFAPYGYKKDPDDKNHLVIDEMAAVVVKRIFEEYLKGFAPRQIAQRLTLDGIICPYAYKKKQGSRYSCTRKISETEVYWRPDTVKRILMNEIYTGTMVQHKQEKRNLFDARPTRLPREEWMRVGGTHEAIIDHDMWQTAQGMMKTVKRDAARQDEAMIFKGLLKCGDCGHAMRKKWDSYTTRAGEKHRYLYYNCGTYRDYGKSLGKIDGSGAGRCSEKESLYSLGTGCSSHYISDAMLRQVILEDVNALLARYEHLERDIEKFCQDKKDSDGLRQAISQKKREKEIFLRRKKAARDKWLDGMLSDEEYEEVAGECRMMLEANQAEMEEVERRLDARQISSDHPWIQKLKETGRLTELDRETVVTLVDQIFVYEDKTIKIIYKFSEEFDRLFPDTI